MPGTSLGRSALRCGENALRIQGQDGNHRQRRLINVFRSIEEGLGRTWYSVFATGSAYGLMINRHRNDADGTSLRAHQIQGWVWAGGYVVPVFPCAGDQRLW